MDNSLVLANVWKKREKHQRMVASCTPPTGDLACKPGMCPERDSNQQPFSLQASTQSTEPHQPGQENQYSLKSNIHIPYFQKF